MNQPISKKVVTPEAKRRGIRYPLGTKIVEYRNRTVFLYPSGKRFVKFKTDQQMAAYINSWPIELDEKD